MHKCPKTIEQVNDNIIEMKQALIKVRRKLGEAHKRFHIDNEKTPLMDIKTWELDITEYEEQIQIAELQKENMILKRSKSTNSIK